MITSGSWRRIARRPLAKVMPARGLIAVWPMPVIAYSTGSSTVRMLHEPSFSALRLAYSVVVLPEPVGPVLSRIPLGRDRQARRACSTSAGIPRLLRSSKFACLSSTRITTRSPWMPGNVETRISTSRPPERRVIRPS